MTSTGSTSSCQIQKSIQLVSVSVVALAVLLGEASALNVTLSITAFRTPGIPGKEAELRVLLGLFLCMGIHLQDCVLLMQVNKNAAFYSTPLPSAPRAARARPRRGYGWLKWVHLACFLTIERFWRYMENWTGAMWQMKRPQCFISI